MCRHSFLLSPGQAVLASSTTTIKECKLTAVVVPTAHVIPDCGPDMHTLAFDPNRLVPLHSRSKILQSASCCQRNQKTVMTNPSILRVIRCARFPVSSSFGLDRAFQTNRPFVPWICCMMSKCCGCEQFPTQVT